MVNLNKSKLSISLLEKLLVNLALPPDLLYHSLKSSFFNDEYSSQSFYERAKAIWHGKIDKYHKLLLIKQFHNGEIPNKTKKICKKSLCGQVRLGLTYFR